MGNATNPDQWAGQERLRFVERCAFWAGMVNRSDLMRVFGLSQAQSSSDLQAYQEINPGALIYNLRKKRYEGSPEMGCKLHDPRLEEAMSIFLGQPVALAGGALGSDGSDVLSMIGLPVRQAPAKVQRAVFQAVLNKMRVRVHYQSFSGKDGRWRTLLPHAFGHDGYRWHVRAWCEVNKDYRDFVLSRMKDAEMPVEMATPPEPDEDWNTWESVTVRPASGLDEFQRKAVAQDFRVTGGKLTLQVRRAMKDYLLDHLRLPLSDGRSRPPMLELVKD